jgi:hypothetical protein
MPRGGALAGAARDAFSACGFLGSAGRPGCVVRLKPPHSPRSAGDLVADACRLASTIINFATFLHMQGKYQEHKCLLFFETGKSLGTLFVSCHK